VPEFGQLGTVSSQGKYFKPDVTIGRPMASNVVDVCFCRGPLPVSSETMRSVR
jgi:hypothetical protein